MFHLHDSISPKSPYVAFLQSGFTWLWDRGIKLLNIVWFWYSTHFQYTPPQLVFGTIVNGLKLRVMLLKTYINCKVAINDNYHGNKYPFHIAKCAVTPHWTPLSIHPLCCWYTPVCFHTECRISAFWRVRFKKRSKIEQKDIITPMHCLAFPSALFSAPFHIDNRTVANCGFWLEYASKTPLEVGADLPRRMRLFWLRCQIMRLRSVHIKPHYSQNAFDSALLAWYERGKSLTANQHQGFHESWLL